MKQDSLLWMEYNNQQNQLTQYLSTAPEKKDSILKVSKQLYQEAQKKNIALAIKFASVPKGLERLYRVRSDIPKDTLSRILNSLPLPLQKSFYGKNIRAHVETTQIKEGDSLVTFSCTQEDGSKFDWKVTTGKQLLLLYGGLGCMGEDGRNYLKQLYATTSREEFLILVYWPCSSLQELKQIKKQYPSDYIFLSDFKEDASPIKIKYGSQATPTCFLTDKQHLIKVKSKGLNPQRFSFYLQTK